jgi:hypothetical protein
MKKTKFKQTGIGKIAFALLCFLSLISLISAEQNIGVDVSILPRGVISTEYNVVGDYFSFMINLANNNSEFYNDKISVEIVAPGNRSLNLEPTSYIYSGDSVSVIYNIPSYNISMGPSSHYEIIPYINSTKDKDMSIWSFDVAGDYYIKICSENSQTLFKKTYTYKTGSLTSSNYVYFPHCFNSYFSVMPQWQYQLFQDQSVAAKKTEEANQKLLDLNVSLERATWIMLFVAVVTLFVATTEEKDRKGLFFKIIKKIATIVVITWIVYLILNFINLI